jgi:peptidoglycan-N-acetylglucosamine deacetylase
MAKRIVCLTFDFDAVSGWISRGMTTPTPMSRGEFGLIGARRILALLKKYGIRSTWFIPGHTIGSFPDRAAEVVAAGHEIAHHGTA